MLEVSNAGSVARRAFICSTAIAAGGVLVGPPPEVGAAIGSGTAGYLPALPYGGRALGAAVLHGQVGNLLCQNRSGGGGLQVQQVLLQSTDPIVAVSWQNRFDYFPLGSTAGGYSDKTKVREKATGIVRAALRGDTAGTVDVLDPPYGGDIKVIACRITSKGTAAAELGPVAGETALIRNCARSTSWQAEWARSGGTGAAPAVFARFPTIWFTRPIDPVAQGWRIGDRIGFGVMNTAPFSSSSEMAPASRWISVNHCFSRDRPDLDRSSFIYDQDVGAYRQSSGSGSGGYETEYFPLLLIGHRGANGRLIVKGNSLAQYAGARDRVFLNANVRYRQIINIPSDPLYSGKRIGQVDTALFHGSPTTDGSVVLQLKLAGARPGASTDNGTLLAQATVSAASYLYLGNINRDIPKTYQMPVFVLPSAPAIQPGRTLYVELSVVGLSQYVMPQMLNYHDRAGNRGLLRPDWQATLGAFQSRTGNGSWVTSNDHPGFFVTLGVQVLFS